MKIERTKKLIQLFILLVICSCGKDTEKDLASGEKNNGNKLPLYLPETLDSGETCYPVKINNKSKVLLTCLGGNLGEKTTLAIWSEDDGLKLITEEMPVAFATSPSDLKLQLIPIDFSDDGKILFSLTTFSDPTVVPVGIFEYTTPSVTHIFDGEKYVTLPGFLYVMSSNGKYFAGTDETGILMYKDFKKVDLSKVTDVGNIYQVAAVNNNGIAVGTTYYADLANSYANNFAVKFSEDGGKILPPPIRPDINLSFGNDINSNGEILLVAEIAEDTKENFFLSRSHSLILREDGTFTELSNGVENTVIYASYFNDNLTTIFNESQPFNGSATEEPLNFPGGAKEFVYFKDDIVSPLSSAVDLFEGETFGGVSTYEPNNKNEVIINVFEENLGYRRRIAKLRK
jgi:hypothetical protein